MDSGDFNMNFTDRPYVVSHNSGITVPANGFKGVGDSYSVRDAWDRDDMEKYAITPAEMLKLRSCFDRINRRTKIKDKLFPPEVRVKRHILRSRFNIAYMKLKQMAIRTRYRYNMRRYINTPPIAQCTHHYDTVLRRLCRLDGMEPGDLQKKKVYIQGDRKQWNRSKNRASEQKGNKAGRRLRRKKHGNHTTNSVLQRLWKSMNETELVNKNIKEQTQGGKSFLKQVVIPGKMLNCMYGKVLPDPTLQPDEIGLPAHVMENVFKNVNMNKIAAIVKRDPVFSSDAITTFTKVKKNDYPYITLPSEIITNKQLDFDGDNVSVITVNSGKCFIETLMRLSPKILMYCYFYRTRLTFSQTNPFRISGLLKHAREQTQSSSEEYSRRVKSLLGNTFAYCHTTATAADVHHGGAVLNVKEQLNETLISLSQQYGPYVPYGFVMLVRHLSFNGYNHKRIYPIGPDVKLQSLNLAESGSKGTPDGVENMFKTTADGDSIMTETLGYAKVFIERKTIIRKDGHNAKKMDSALQNVIVNHDNRLTMKVNNVIYDLGHVINYIQREWVMTDLTIKCLIDDVEDDDTLLGLYGKGGCIPNK